MEALLLYLLKANVVLALFAAAYYGLLRRLTFFELNRGYLLLALVFAAVYPLLPVPALLPASVGSLPLPTEQFSMRIPRVTTLSETHDYLPYVLNSLVVLYVLGAGLLLLRLLGQLLSLGGVWVRSRPAVVLGQPVRVVPGASGPFSFGGTIYLSAATLADAAGLPAILRHEQAHVRQWHTLDVLLTQAAVALAWANPAAWLLRRAVLDNLEFLADRAALQTGLDRRAYQYSLLHQQPSGVPAPALAFHFSFPTLKNRIVMLNQPTSTTRQLGRYLLAAPLVMLLALGYSGARAQTTNTFAVRLTGPNAPKEPFMVTAPAVVDHLVYYVDAQPSTAAAANAIDPKSIASMEVLKDNTTIQHYANDPTATGVAFITTKANANSPAVLAFADKAELSSGYTFKPAAVNAVVPKALAYITSHYPDARLSGEVKELTKKSTGAVKYQVQLIIGKRPFYAYFTPQGDFLADERQ